VATKTRFKLRNDWGDALYIDEAPYYMKGINGLGFPMPEYATQLLAYRDGEELMGSRLGRREVGLALRIVVDDPGDLEGARDELLAVFGDLSRAIWLVAERRDGSVRELPIRYGGNLALPHEPNRGILDNSIEISLLSFKPLWIDQHATHWVYAIPSGLGAWSYPLAFPEGFGQSNIHVTEAKSYPGTYRAYPVITVQGPCADLRIENETTDHVLRVAPGYVISLGETVVLDLREGYKTVTSSTGATTLQTFENSPIELFHIAAPPDALSGINVLRVSLAHGGASTSVKLTFHPRYLSY
jgi:hypothetical protein